MAGQHCCSLCGSPVGFFLFLFKLGGRVTRSARNFDSTFSRHVPRIRFFVHLERENESRLQAFLVCVSFYFSLLPFSGLTPFALLLGTSKKIDLLPITFVIIGVYEKADVDANLQGMCFAAGQGLMFCRNALSYCTNSIK